MNVAHRCRFEPISLTPLRPAGRRARACATSPRSGSRSALALGFGAAAALFGLGSRALAETPAASTTAAPPTSAPAAAPAPTAKAASAAPSAAPSAPPAATTQPPAPAPTTSGNAPAPVVPAPPAPASVTPVSTAPASAPLPTPVAAPLAPRVVTTPGAALVHVAVSYPRAWLELRSYVDGGEFVRACAAPCDRELGVEGREARVTAPGMTPSNIFRFDAGEGVAGVRVDGGSASARRAGVITLAVGIPVALAGMALFGMGRVKHSSGLEASGIAGLAAGGVSIAVSLPLLMLGSTHVKNAKGSQIAFGEPWSPAL